MARAPASPASSNMNTPAAVASPASNVASTSTDAGTAGQTLHPPKTPSSALTPDQRAKRAAAIESALSASSQPHPPDTPLSARSRTIGSTAAKGTANKSRLALLEEALSPSKASGVGEAGPSDYRPLPGIEKELQQAKTPSPPAADSAAASKKSTPSSPSKRSFVEVISDDEEEQFWNALSDSPRPRKVRRHTDPTEDVVNASGGANSSAPSDNTPTLRAVPAVTSGDKGKGKAKQTDKLVSDPVSRHTSSCANCFSSFKFV